ncbi:hypothetical protein [Streptomyces sp. NPDC051135]|uniref:hypothetical protein n=1 Tax=unclassified Streptomyces TaxID=2593676 RepID=UPI003415AAA0
MSTPARRRACPSLSRQHAAADRAGRSVRRAGWLLCWSLAAGMGGATTETLLHSSAIRWPLLWPLPWYLTLAGILTWSLLRLREKAAHRQPEDHDDLQTKEYGQAA